MPDVGDVKAREVRHPGRKPVPGLGPCQEISVISGPVVLGGVCATWAAPS